jgi:5S rRNA maturation endonuclease (ribonuclease M5)
LTSNSSFEEIRKKADEARNIELDAVLQHFGSTKDHQDKTKWHTSQGIISVNGPKFMNWTQGTGGGGAIDLVIHLHGVGFKDAVLWLYDHFSSSFVQKPSPNKSRPVKQILKLPQKDDKKLPQVQQYLINRRCIPEELIKNLIQSKKIYADIRGNAVFLLLGKKKRVVGAELRGTCNQKWRGMAPGSRKDLGCFYVVGKNSRKMVLCESAIDAASCVALYPEYTAISTSGAAADPAWLQNFIINGCKIYCGFDADRTGDTMAKKMIKQYPSIKRLRPHKHDWNEVLQSNSL